jgi:transposase-like protein
MSQRRRYSPEYKQEAIRLVQQSNTPISQIARNLGINDLLQVNELQNYGECYVLHLPHKTIISI